MNIYTLILEYSKGTFIAQVKAKNEIDAIKNWLANIDSKKYKGFTKNIICKFINEDFKDEKPTLINGCQNVWCFCFRIKNELTLVHIVKTYG